eukprot:CAMPEP_0119105380 /NCGR_PEP_ID=MMETSP1180-20130426/3353_1 /TAXON_ID=3052 ORGANISM="Chlamydomonas cf sp, Strain CCMP681" /NCGR_SAMPLE_ID=MMETSP1180 /ASSEMBLY_ACC=CAM_ASM_000741 /LENGTH=69 /DNA_ID=CAMNT_0007090411 /DNA_START=369 /DNA_END=578 /DNA_ORIENTATION=-
MAETQVLEQACVTGMQAAGKVDVKAGKAAIMQVGVHHRGEARPHVFYQQAHNRCKQHQSECTHIGHMSQ